MFHRLLRGPFSRALAVIVVANLLFLVLTIVAPADPDLVAQRIRTAFETGELGTTDYLPFDSRRGWHQYADCGVLQWISNSNPSRIVQGLAPIGYAADEDANGSCAVLYSLVMEGVDRDSLIASNSARYWYGYNALASFALRVMELKELRQLLSGAVWVAILLLLLAAYRSGRHLRLAGASMALVAATFWAVPYFAPGLAHGPGDALLLLALAGVIVWPRMAASPGVIIPYAAGFGSGVVFFTMLTGQLPTAAAWLMALTLAARRDEKSPEGLSGPLAAWAAVLAFGLGAAATVVAKQIAALAVADADSGGEFLSHLDFYMRIPASEEGWPGILVPFGRLVRKSSVLTYGNSLASYGLIATAALMWLAALVRGWRHRHGERVSDTLILISAALIPMAWVLLLPGHTYIHAAFMARMLVVPISLAPVALFWPALRRAGDRHTRERSVP